MTHFSLETASIIVSSNEQFPIDFDDAWVWLEYSRKDNAKVHFKKCNFVEAIDYLVFLNSQENPLGGRPSEDIKLSIECFKMWAMMTNTQKGQEVRKYFLECEAKLKAQQAIIQNKQLPKNFVEALRQLADTHEQLAIAEKSLQGYRNIYSGAATLSFKQAADALAIKGLGQNKLIDLLRSKGVLAKKGSAPLKKFIDAGYFVVNTSEWTSNGGVTRTTQTGQLTFKGFCWLVQVLERLNYTIRTTPQAIWDEYFEFHSEPTVN